MARKDSEETLRALAGDYAAGDLSLGELVRYVYIVGQIDGNEKMLDAFDMLGDAGHPFDVARVALRQKFIEEMMAIYASTAAGGDVECDA